MYGNERAETVRSLLHQYVRSPSLRHLRDPHSIDKLTRDIINAIDRHPSLWDKWDKLREDLVRASARCWVPIDDLHAFLNGLPGPRLTRTDVEQRQRAIHEEPYEHYPNQEVREGCLALYEREKAEGTELPAIIGALQVFIEDEEDRLRREHEQRWRRARDEEQAALEQRFLAGADCKWTTIRKSAEVYTRRNGRTYRLVPRKDKRWDLFRITELEDEGALIGTYGSRGDASKAVAKLAYEPEPRW